MQLNSHLHNPTQSKDMNGHIFAHLNKLFYVTTVPTVVENLYLKRYYTIVNELLLEYRIVLNVNSCF